MFYRIVLVPWFVFDLDQFMGVEVIVMMCLNVCIKSQLICWCISLLGDQFVCLMKSIKCARLSSKTMLVKKIV